MTAQKPTRSEADANFALSQSLDSDLFPGDEGEPDAQANAIVWLVAVIGVIQLSALCVLAVRWIA